MSPFLLSEEKIGPYTLKPWSVFTQLAVSELSKHELTEVEQMLAFVWIQSKDPKSIRASLSKGTAIDEIREFADNFPLAYVGPMSAWVQRQNDLIAQNQIEIIPKPGGEDPDAPKN
jgi:hypothetical protein